MKKVFFIITILAVQPLFAQTAMSSLLVNADPVALGHAGASVALDADAFALENNTAAMSFYEGRMDAGVSYCSWQPSTGKDKLLNAGAYFKPGEKLALGLSFGLFKMPSYDIYDSDGVKPQLNGTFSPNEYKLALGASYLLGPRFSAGLNLKLASSSLAPQSKATSFAADVYAAYKSVNGVNVGLGICNLGTKANYGSTSYSLPEYLRGGVAYKIKSFSVDAELDYLFSGSIMAAASAGWWFRNIVGLNAGYHYGSGKHTSVYIPSYLSVGLGLKLAGFHLDGAVLLANKDLAGTFSLSLGYNF